MYGIYCKNDEETELIAKVQTKEEAERIVNTINYWCDEVYEFMGHSDFEENFGQQEYIIKEETNVPYYRLYDKNNTLVKESELFEDITVYLDERWQELCAERGLNDSDMKNFDTLAYMLLSYRLEEDVRTEEYVIKRCGHE